MTTNANILPNLRLAPIDNPTVVALAYDGLCTFEFGITAEIFGLNRPEMGENWYRFATAAIEPGPLRAHGGLTVGCDGGLELLESAGLIVIPGWRGIDAPVPDALLEALIAAHARGARLASICSGAFVLARTGLLDGHCATTHWRYAEAFRQRFPKVQLAPDTLYVAAGRLLTSAGSAAGLDMGLHLIREDFGAEAANSVARRLVMPAHRAGGQAQFLPRPVPRAEESDRLSPILDLLRASLDDPPPNRALAARAGMSERTFLRRFEEVTGTTPQRFVTETRLARATELLETTPLSIDQVAEAAGFASATLLRHHFQTRYALSPGAYRRRFHHDRAP